MPNYYILTSDGTFVSDDELCHYGVKGQKWGVRRYQNADGTLTAAGKKKARQEYKADNQMAFELGKTATITGHAAARSMNRTVKLENKLDKQYTKDPDGVTRRTKNLNKKWEASAKTTAQLTSMYMKNKEMAEKHCKSLIDKYGKEAVSSIKYTDVKVKKGQYNPTSFKTMNERTNSLSDYAQAGAITMFGISAMFLGSPVGLVMRPTTTTEKAARVERAVYTTNRK